MFYFITLKQKNKRYEHNNSNIINQLNTKHSSVVKREKAKENIFTPLFESTFKTFRE